MVFPQAGCGRRRAAARSNSPRAGRWRPRRWERGYRGPGLHHPTFLCPAGDLIPCRERGEVFNVCREIKRKFPSRLMMLSSTRSSPPALCRAAAAARQRSSPDRRVGGGEQAEIVGAERHHFPQLRGGALRGELFAGEMGEGAARFGMAHDGVHPAGLQQLIEIGRKIPGVGREQRKLAIQRSANGGVHIEMTTVDRPRRIGGAIKACTACSSAKARRDSFPGDRQMAAAEQAIQVVMQIAARGADRRQITKDDQQRLRERLPPRSDRGLAAAAVQSARSHCHARRRRIVARRHGAVGSSCKMPSPSQRASMPAGKVHACRRQCSKSLTGAPSAAP